jgi:hypothetical protein
MLLNLLSIKEPVLEISAKFDSTSHILKGNHQNTSTDTYQMSDKNMAVTSSGYYNDHTDRTSEPLILLFNSDGQNSSNHSLSLESLSYTNDDSSNLDDFWIDEDGNLEETEDIKKNAHKTPLPQQGCGTSCTLTETDDSYVQSSSALSTSSLCNGLSEVAQDSYNLLIQQRQNMELLDDYDDEDSDDDDDTFSYNSTDALMDPDDDDDDDDDVRVHSSHVDLNRNTELQRRHVQFGFVTVREYYCNDCDDNVASNEKSYVDISCGRIASHIVGSTNKNDCISMDRCNTNVNMTTNASHSTKSSSTIIKSEITFPCSDDYASYKRLMQRLSKRQQQHLENQSIV